MVYNRPLGTIGDPEQACQDVKVLWDIINRQGCSLLLDVIAEHVGETVVRFRLSAADAERMRDSYLKEFKDAINERI